LIFVLRYIYFWFLIGETRIEFDVNYLAGVLDEWHEIVLGIEICQYCGCFWGSQSRIKIRNKSDW